MSMFRSLLFRERRTSSEAVIEIGSGSIKALVFERKEAPQPPVIIKKLIENFNPNVETGEMVSELYTFLSTLIKTGGGIPESLVIGLGPSLGEPVVKTTQMFPPWPSKRFSRSELASLFSHVRAGQTITGRTLYDVPVSLSANGYLVKPERLEQVDSAIVQELSFRTVAISCPSDVASVLEELKRTWGGLPIHFVPLAGVYEEVIRNKKDLENSFFIEIGGTHTLLMMRMRAALAEISFFQYGISHIIGRISQIFQISMRDAEDRCRQYTQGLMQENERQALHEVLLQEVEVWKQALIRGLEVFYPVGPLPKDIAVWGEGASYPEIISVLRSSDWLSDFSAAEKPAVRVIEGRSLFEGDSLGGSLGGPEDFGIGALLAYALSRQLESDNIIV